MYRIDLGDGYFMVPADAVTLNGLELSQLNTADADYVGRMCLIMPDGKAAMNHDGNRRYVYLNEEECRDDKAKLKELRDKYAAEEATEAAEQLSVGTLVVPVVPHKLLQGTKTHPFAVVGHTTPLVLVSAEGDMQWDHLKVLQLRVIGTATAEVLKAVNKYLNKGS